MALILIKKSEKIEAILKHTIFETFSVWNTVARSTFAAWSFHHCHPAMQFFSFYETEIILTLCDLCDSWINVRLLLGAPSAMRTQTEPMLLVIVLGTECLDHRTVA